MSTGRPAPPLGDLVAVPTHRGEPTTPASDLIGIDLGGRPAARTVTADGALTLVLFLSSACQGCVALWQAAAGDRWGLPPGAAMVVVTRGAPTEDAGALQRLAPPGAEVIVSDAAWAAYRVRGAPFFVLVEGGRRHVLAEGVAFDVGQVAGEVSRAVAARGLAGGGGCPATSGG